MRRSDPQDNEFARFLNERKSKLCRAASGQGSERCMRTAAKKAAADSRIPPKAFGAAATDYALLLPQGFGVRLSSAAFVARNGDQPSFVALMRLSIGV
jgi:hypothetical protein